MPQEKRLFSSESEDEEKEYKPTKKKSTRSKEVESSEEESDISESLEESSDEEQEEKKSKRVKKEKKLTTEKKVDVARNGDGDQIFPLSAKRRVTVRSFSNGGASIDIRETYKDKDGQDRPGKGICLPLDQWKKLCGFLPDIEQAIAALSNKK